MLKRVTLVIVSLLLLNGCAELVNLLGGVEVVGEMTLYDRSIQVSNIHETGFTLTWSEASYSDGTYGSFYYELYVVEGDYLNVNNLYFGDKVTSGRNLKSYNVSGLEPGRTYSYVVAVSEDEFGSQLYYNVGTTNTQFSYINNDGYSPNNYNINVYDITTDGFTLSWDPTTYNDGAYGSFYYELYVVEGEIYNVDNLNYNDLEASGWDISSHTVTYLNPDTTYSYVIGVSEDGTEPQVYYNIGMVTTDTYYNNTYSPYSYYIDVYNVYENGFDLSWFNTQYDNGSYGEFYYEVYVIEGEIYNTDYLSYSDKVTSGWDITSYYVSGLNSGTTYSFVVGVSNDTYGSQVYYDIGYVTTLSDYTPTPIYIYPSYSWVEGYLAYGETTHYTVYVNPGSTYTVSWNDFDGNGDYTTDIKVSAYDEFGNSFFIDDDAGYYSNTNQTIVIPYNVYSIDIMVNGLSYGNTGYFGLKVEEIY